MREEVAGDTPVAGQHEAGIRRDDPVALEGFDSLAGNRRIAGILDLPDSFPVALLDGAEIHSEEKVTEM